MKEHEWTRSHAVECFTTKKHEWTRSLAAEHFSVKHTLGIRGFLAAGSCGFFGGGHQRFVLLTNDQSKALHRWSLLPYFAAWLCASSWPLVLKTLPHVLRGLSRMQSYSISEPAAGKPRLPKLLQSEVLHLSHQMLCPLIFRHFPLLILRPLPCGLVNIVFTQEILGIKET